MRVFVKVSSKITFLDCACYVEFRGKIFVGNTGSFAMGLTIAAFAVILDMKVNLVISLLPYSFNSSLILLTVFVIKKKAAVSFDAKKLCSDSRKSLVKFLTYQWSLIERLVVTAVSLLVVLFTLLGLLIQVIIGHYAVVLLWEQCVP